MNILFQFLSDLIYGPASPKNVNAKVVLSKFLFGASGPKPIWYNIKALLHIFVISLLFAVCFTTLYFSLCDTFGWPSDPWHTLRDAIDRYR